MASDVTEMVNLALQFIGEPQIMDIDEPENRAGREVSLAWPNVRDEILGRWDWNFARDRRSIPKLASKPAFGYEFEYAEPTDSVKVWSIDESFTRFGDQTDIFTSTGGRLSTGSREGAYGSGTRFVVEDGKIRTDKDILTDLTVVDIPGLPVTFTKRVESVAKYPSWMVPVFYHRLAMVVAMAITGDRTIFSDAAALYDRFYREARAINAREGVLERRASFFVAIRE